MKIYRFLNFFLNFFILIPPLMAQVPDVRVEVGETQLARPGDPFEIKVYIKNPQGRAEVIFPEIHGTDKGSTTRLRSNVALDGENFPQEIVIQQYLFAGDYLEVRPTVVRVEGNNFDIPGFVIRVNKVEDDSVATDDAEAHLNADPFIPEHLDREDVFLTVRPTKSSVYLREGFGLYFSLFVAKDVRLFMEFYDLDRQLNQIRKQLQADGCWEENTWIEEIVPRTVTIRERDYTEYRLYQSVFFPFIEKDVQFPSISLKMNMGEQGTVIRTFYTRPVTVHVKSLPPHPLKDAVSVGIYELSEELSTPQTPMGQPFKYVFGIVGEGNIAAIAAPMTIPVQTFEFYPPEVTQSLQSTLRAVNGIKKFEYTLVPRQKGTFPLQGYFQWIYFDPLRAQYDTLRSMKMIEVTEGEGAVSETMVPMGENRVYANLERLNSAEVYRNYNVIFRIVMNVVVILMLLSALWIFRK